MNDTATNTNTGAIPSYEHLLEVECSMFTNTKTRLTKEGCVRNQELGRMECKDCKTGLVVAGRKITPEKRKRGDNYKLFGFHLSKRSKLRNKGAKMPNNREDEMKSIGDPIDCLKGTYTEESGIGTEEPEVKVKMKWCTKCNELKPISAFGPNIHSKDGLRHRCRTCVSADMRERRKKNITSYLRLNISDWPDLKQKLERVAKLNVRTIENQAIFYISQGIERDLNRNP